MTRYTVRLADDTVGSVFSDTIDDQPIESFIGETLNVHLRDENGNPIETSGKVVEILDTEENSSYNNY
jgi:hypothetical protein